MSTATKVKPNTVLDGIIPFNSHLSLNMGCDPEFFFKSEDGSVVGSEKLIPKEGATTSSLEELMKQGYNKSLAEEVLKGQSKIIIDGVQAELNPRPSTCRQSLAYEITMCLQQVKKIIAAKGGKITADLTDTTVEVSPEEMASLDEKSRKFGCAPSSNIHTTTATIMRDGVVEQVMSVDPEKYMKRSAGGHIHLSGEGVSDLLNNVIRKRPKDVVLMLDILVGNTCVLLDRNPGNIERRKVYGRAGEYREPKHGLEYRSLSNFWLMARPLQSFVFGMARLAVEIVADEQSKPTLFDRFVSLVNVEDIHKAINENDFDLALSNFNKIEDLLLVITPPDGRYVIHRDNINLFAHFVSRIQEHGLKYWFPVDPLEHWCVTQAYTNPQNPDRTYTDIGPFFLDQVKTDLDQGQKLRLALNAKLNGPKKNLKYA